MESLAYQIAETSLAIRRAFDRRAARLGVTGAQWKVLLRLSRTPGLRQVELADMMDVEPITLSRIVDRLEQSGLVERCPDPADRRVWRLRLTAKAQPLVEELRAIGDDMLEQAFEGLSEALKTQLSQTLATVRANLAAAESVRKAVNQ